MDDEPHQLDQPQHILAKIPNTTSSVHSYVDRSVSMNHSYTYMVTAVNRLHHESSASNAKKINL
jgi:hypothetical protein